MRKWKHLREEEFKQLKSLLDAGVKPSKLVVLFARSGNVIATVKTVPTFAEYVRVGKERNNSRKEIKLPNPGSRGVGMTTDMEQYLRDRGLSTVPNVVDVLLRIEQLLTEIKEQRKGIFG